MIQGVRAVRENLLVLVRRGRDHRVVREGLPRDAKNKSSEKNRVSLLK